MSKEKLLRFAERAMKRTKIYQYNRELNVPDEENYKMSYLLVKGNGKDPERILAYAVNDESVLLFHPMENPVYEVVLNDWQFYFDYDLFQYLEGGYDLTAMTPDAHSGVWYEMPVSRYRRDCVRRWYAEISRLLQTQRHYQRPAGEGEPAMTAWT